MPPKKKVAAGIITNGFYVLVRQDWESLVLAISAEKLPELG